MQEVVKWIIIAVIGLTSFFAGMAMSYQRVPRWIVFITPTAIVIASGVGLFLLSRHSKHFELTGDYLACFLGMIIGSIIVLRKQERPRIPWPDYINSKIDPIMKVCERHKWDLTSRDAVLTLASNRSLHFNGGDYHLLMAGTSRNFLRWARVDRIPNTEVFDRTPKTEQGSIDYDRACAKEIVFLCGHIAGNKYIKGVLNTAKPGDLRGVDWQALEKLQWLAVALAEQWGLPAPHGLRSPKPQAEAAVPTIK